MAEPPHPEGPNFKDKSSHLAVGGCLWIGVALLCLAMTAYMAVVGAVAGAFGQAMPAMNVASVVVSVAFYGALAVLAAAIGIGSFRVRRWARALGLALAGPWLAYGLLSLLASAVVVPLALRAVPAPRGAQPPDPVMMGVVIAVVLVVLVVPMVVLPAVLLWLYAGRDARATVEWKDPRPRWTDRCPVPVLALVLLHAWGALFSPALLAYPALPWLGVVFRGPGLWALSALFTVVMVLLAVACFRLRPAGWWGTLAAWMIGFGGGVVTFLKWDLVEIYEMMGVPIEQMGPEAATMLESLQAGPLVVGVMIAGLGILLAFLLYLRRYFVNAPAPA